LFRSRIDVADHPHQTAVFEGTGEGTSRPNFNGDVTSDEIARKRFVDLESCTQDGEIEDSAFMPPRFEIALETVLR
jgi:hypothetical protein